MDPQAETWEDVGDVDPDQGYEEVDPLDARMGYIEEEPRYAVQATSTSASRSGRTVA